MAGAIQLQGAKDHLLAELHRTAETNPLKVFSPDGRGGTLWRLLPNLIPPAGQEGKVGPRGATGSKGDQGDAGAAGADGIDGADGEDGAPGLDGAPGVDGDDGAPGLDGAPGTNGTNGVDGSDGADGADGAPGIPTALAAIGSTPNANGMTLSGSTLNLEPASSSFGGVVTTGTQTFAGAKTLLSELTITPTSPGAGTAFDGVHLENTTPATAGNQQYSPALHLLGQGWKTNATAGSQAVEFREFVAPVQGAANPTGRLTYQYSVNGGAFSTLAYLNSAGEFRVADGTAAAPSHAFVNNVGAGMFLAGTNILGFSTAAVERARITALGQFLVGTTTAFNAQTMGEFLAPAAMGSTYLRLYSTANDVEVLLGATISRGRLYSRTGAGGAVQFTLVVGASDALHVDTSSNLCMGIAPASARAHFVATTEQLRLGYDASNYFSTTIGSTGGVTFNAVGSGARFSFSDGITLPAGTATAGTSPLLFVSGTNLTTAVNGAMEYNGTNLFFTRTAATRESVWVGNDAAAAPATNAVGVIVDYFGTSATRVLTTPNSWASVVIAGTTYKIPLYA